MGLYNNSKILILFVFRIIYIGFVVEVFGWGILIFEFEDELFDFELEFLKNLDIFF